MKIPPISHGNTSFRPDNNNNPIVNQLDSLYSALQKASKGSPHDIEQAMADIKKFITDNSSKIEQMCKSQGWTGKEPQNYSHILHQAIFNDIKNYNDHPNDGSLDEAMQDIHQLSWFMTHGPR